MKALSSRLAAALALLVLPAVSHAQKAQVRSEPIFNRADMDTTCAACTDFYEYANGGWLKAHQNAIPADRTSISSFSTLSEHNTDVAHKVMQDDSAAVKSGRAKPGTEQWKIGTYYTACMDTASIDALGTQPVEATLQKINAINSSADLVRSFAELRGGSGGGGRGGGGGLTPFGVRPSADPKNSTETIVSAGPGGLGLPEREYYFRTDARSANVRKEYVAHIARSLQLAGESEAQAKSDAEKAMALETELARRTATRAQMRDPNASYHKMTIDEFSALTPHVNWRAYVDAVGGQGGRVATVVNVTQPNYFKGLDSLISNVPIDEWKAYLRWHAVSAAAPRLDTRFSNEDFQFQKVMQGVEQPQPRWRTCYAATNGALGWAVGHEYIARTFTPADRERARAMVENLVSALHDRIQTLDWMSPATKQEATTKLDAYLRKVAYPDKWMDYSALQVKPGQYYENGVLDAAWNQNRAWSRVGKPVDKTEWSMTPPTVNASYSPSLNQIQFPAGILAPPFFDPNADDAVNYGALGAVIGHEMSHGFDDQGRQFDAKGNLRDWWTAADAAKYKANAQKMVEQYNGYTVIDSSTHVNGQATLGENIGDFGGLTIAYAAMEKALDAKGPSARRKVGGFTPEQRFFLSWARVWREVQRPEAERLQVNTNPHSPGKWRVNGPLSIMPEFAKAWGCREGDPMVRPESQRARIW